MSDVVLQTDIPGFPVRRGKVRDIYDMGSDLLIVASDRISAFDCILPTGIPHKGKVLTQLSVFWFKQLKDVTSSHLVSAPTAASEIARIDPALGRHAASLAGRSMLVRKARVLPVECVVRGYLAGSGWKSYQASSEVCGIPLPEGLKEASRLAEPIFTPATKAETGHDENISFAGMGDMIGDELATQVRDRSLALYVKARDYAIKRGIIVCDTKFEWGLIDGALTLVDEALTPDSSRFWPADRYSPGRAQPSFDKQFVRDYLETLDWDKTPPAPQLPDEVVRKTSEKYIEAYEKLTGKTFPKT
ncbi:MAG TPA: phosphoribosylaminoimidazolesuccinocarboxamide synthase [Planctomycetota bacterium]|nr:phosphoribosylaminoimidazolesuccinocarboxamide synthase [Planctomycetota bacterium]